MHVLQFAGLRRSAAVAIVAAFLTLLATGFGTAAQETPTGTLRIVNIACTNLEESEVVVTDYEGDPPEALPELEAECSLVSGSYTILPNGSEDEAITASTDESGVTTINVPVTDGTPHTVIEDATGATTEIEVTAGNSVELQFFGPSAADGDEAEGAATPEAEDGTGGAAEDEAAAEDDAVEGEAEDGTAEVSGLPATGQGQPQGGALSPAWLAAGIAAILTISAGVATYTVRRRNG